jgi:hypothetical protein
LIIQLFKKISKFEPGKKIVFIALLNRLKKSFETAKAKAAA